MLLIQYQYCFAGCNTSLNVVWSFEKSVVTYPCLSKNNYFIYIWFDGFNFCFTAPSRPGNLYAKASGPKFIRVQWSAPSQAGSGIEFYKLQFRSEYDTSWREVQVNPDPDMTYELTGLQPNTLYNIQMCAVGRVGNKDLGSAECTSDWSTVLQARTDIDSKFETQKCSKKL